MIKQSIQKTRKVLFVNEDTEVANFGEHLSYRAMKEEFYYLLAPPKVLAGKQVPGVGLHSHLEEATVPQKQDIQEAIKDLVEAKF